MQSKQSIAEISNYQTPLLNANGRRWYKQDRSSPKQKQRELIILHFFLHLLSFYLFFCPFV